MGDLVRLSLEFEAQQNRGYPIVMAEGLLSRGEAWAYLVRGQQLCVVTNQAVGALYLETLLANFPDKQVLTVYLEDGEPFKSMAAIMQICDALMQARFNRDATIMALGGGIVGDVAGFAAACYQRGVPFVQVPTTLLAQVDSSVGGKTGVNHPLGKNMIGAFYQPQAVMIDVATLRSLPKREFSAGLAEAIKYALIGDVDFFGWLERNRSAIVQQQAEVLIEMIARCCKHKAAIVASDEREAGARALLNLGHTFAHAIETLTRYERFKHGEAVAIGMRLAAELSRLLGYVSVEEVGRLRALLQAVGLPDSLPRDLAAEEILSLMYLDKKVASGRLRLVLMVAFGRCEVISGVADEDILQALIASYAD